MPKAEASPGRWNASGSSQGISRRNRNRKRNPAGNWPCRRPPRPHGPQSTSGSPGTGPSRTLSSQHSTAAASSMPMPEGTPSSSQPTGTGNQPEQNASEPSCHRAANHSAEWRRGRERTAEASGSPQTEAPCTPSSSPKAPSTHSPHSPCPNSETPEPSSSRQPAPAGNCPHGPKHGNPNASSAPSTPMTPATRQQKPSQPGTRVHNASDRKAERTGTPSSWHDTRDKPQSPKSAGASPPCPWSTGPALSDAFRLNP